MSLSPETRQRLGQVTNSFAVREDVDRWIDLLFASARHFHPECRCVLLSDETTPLGLHPGVEIVRGPSVADDPLWSRLNAERRFLQSLPPEMSPAPIAFLDFDIIVNAALDGLFRDALPSPWDVCLTYREGDMPINGGVVLVQAGRYQEALCFFDDLLETYLAHFRAEPWWGEQLSLKSAVGEAGLRPETAVICRGNYHIGLLPGQQYNHTPRSASDALRVTSDVKILHFKGKRKTFMADYWRWRRCTAASDPPNGLRLTAAAARLRILARAGRWN